MASSVRDVYSGQYWREDQSLRRGPLRLSLVASCQTAENNLVMVDQGVQQTRNALTATIGEWIRDDW
jgi:hypothetical protein